MFGDELLTTVDRTQEHITGWNPATMGGSQCAKPNREKRERAIAVTS